MYFSPSSMHKAVEGNLVQYSSSNIVLSSFFLPKSIQVSPFPFPTATLSFELTDTFSQLHFQNLVMFMSEFVDWIIPDIPKDISQQIHKEKVLMVEVFMREEQGKLQMLETWKDKDKRKGENCNNHSPGLSRSRSGSLSSCHSYPLDV